MKFHTNLFIAYKDVLYGKSGWRRQEAVFDGRPLFRFGHGGERGQVVIPADARKRFQIEPGDKLLMMSTPDDKSLMLCRLDSLREFMNAFQEGLTRIEQDLATGSSASPAPHQNVQTGHSAGSASPTPLTEEEENRK